MMHDREKSHSAIVAAKPTNNAPASKADAAELGEPRAGTKRKADGQSRLRTQGRDRVSQALDLLRESFHALTDAMPPLPSRSAARLPSVSGTRAVVHPIETTARWYCPIYGGWACSPRGLFSECFHEPVVPDCPMKRHLWDSWKHSISR